VISPLDFLRSSQTQEGGWGYAPGHSPGVEPTCAVLHALKRANQETAFQDAVSWLLHIQNEDGGWGYNQNDQVSGWLSAWAVWTLSIFDSSSKQVEDGVQYLLAQNVMQINNLDDLEAGKKIANIDFSLRGWPWRPGEASWVEPTALALIALSASGLDAGSRVNEAVRYLDNRRCPNGGWNVGNPIMFGEALPARANPTALSLIALSKTSPNKILPIDLEALTAEMKSDSGTMALAWGCLAIRSCKSQVEEEFLHQLSQRQLSDGSWEHNPYLTAVSWLAIAEAEV